MSNNLNQCMFTGRLGKDVDARYTQEGSAIASFSIAVGSQWKNKAGEKQESVEWVNCSVFGKLAEICIEYLRKGSFVFVAGKMKTDKYTDKKTGEDKYTTNISFFTQNHPAIFSTTPFIKTGHNGLMVFFNCSLIRLRVSKAW